ncbi:MAG: hypothetical protein ACPLOU_08180 [bacterium]
MKKTDTGKPSFAGNSGNARGNVQRGFGNKTASTPKQTHKFNINNKTNNNKIIKQIWQAQAGLLVLQAFSMKFL